MRPDGIPKVIQSISNPVLVPFLPVERQAFFMQTLGLCIAAFGGSNHAKVIQRVGDADFVSPAAFDCQSLLMGRPRCCVISLDVSKITGTVERLCPSGGHLRRGSLDLLILNLLIRSRQNLFQPAPTLEKMTPDEPKPPERPGETQPGLNAM